MKKLLALGAGLAVFLAAVKAETFAPNFDDTGGWTAVKGDFRIAPERKILEKTMGAPDFIKVRNLSPGDPNVALSRMVGQFLRVPANKNANISVCSGSLVGASLFLTNHHCVEDKAGGIIPIAEVLIAMEHLNEKDLGPRESVAGVTRILASSKDLDYALLELTAPLGEKYGWLELERDTSAVVQERVVKIIQHPAGRSKEIVTTNTEVVKVANPWLHYLADTEGGSSGSPVFSLTGEKIIALHHAGIEGKYNEGVVISFIADEIARFLPVGAVARNVAQAPVQQPSPSSTAPAGDIQADPADAPLLAQPGPPKPANDPDNNGGWTPVTGDED